MVGFWHEEPAQKTGSFTTCGYHVEHTSLYQSSKQYRYTHTYRYTYLPLFTCHLSLLYYSLERYLLKYIGNPQTSQNATWPPVQGPALDCSPSFFWQVSLHQHKFWDVYYQNKFLVHQPSPPRESFAKRKFLYGMLLKYSRQWNGTLEYYTLFTWHAHKSQNPKNELQIPVWKNNKIWHWCMW